MANTPNIQAPQAAAITVFHDTTPAIKAPQGVTMVPYNVPAKGINTTGLVTSVAYRRIANDLRAANSNLMVVYKGKVDNPKLKSWTYTMDSHDLYVLKLGTFYKTLVFDLTTHNWSWWTSNPANDLSQPDWKPSTGLNWLSAGSIPYEHGSNVIVGDESQAILWVLDPDYSLDDNIDTAQPPVTFERIATGQVTTAGRNFIPVYEIDLSFATGQPALTSDSVTLTYSDDVGKTYVQADGPVTVFNGDYYQEMQWRSLGQIRAPGRLFRITDNGAFTRIDSLDLNPEVGT